MSKAALAFLLLALTTWHGEFIANSSAQQTPKIHRVGLLHPSSAVTSAKVVDAFREEMRRLGYTDANLVIELRYAEQRAERLQAFAIELAQSKIDVFFAPTEPALLAAKEASAAIPIVTVSCDPLEKLVGRLNRPGGNVTGFSCVSSAIAGKRLSFLKTLNPTLKRVALLYRPADAYEPDLNNVEQSGQKLGLSVTRFPVKAAEDFEAAFVEMEKGRHQALYIQLSGFANFHRRTFAQLALKHRLPAIFGFREFADAGGLLSYGASLSDGYRRAAYFVDRILKGARTSDLPAEEPTHFELVVNLKTAKALGITIPAEILIQATSVIE